MKTLMRIITALGIISSVVYKSEACSWYDNGEGYRISMFRAEIYNLLGYQAFYYTPNLMNDYWPRTNNEDRYKNCREWKSLLGCDCKIEDIYKMLYETDAKQFIKDIQAKNNNKYESNTFFIGLTKNKDWFMYFFIAKLNELQNENISAASAWYDPSSYTEQADEYSKVIPHEKFIDLLSKAMQETNNEDVEERLAYHLIRAYRQADEDYKAIETYKKYFASPENKSIVKTWALLHYAQALQETGEAVKANLIYSRIFSMGEEKRIRAYTLFNKELFESTLKIAKNNEDISNIWAIMAIKNPGPAMQEIKKVIANNPQNSAIPLLVMREINKLEDWIFTPSQTVFAPSMHRDKHFKSWNDDYEKIKQQNKDKDLQYLKQFNSYIKSEMSKFNPKWKNFMLLARAHSCLMAKENKEALKLFKQVPDDASNSIIAQKNIELALYYTFEHKLKSKKVRQQLAASLQMLEKLSKKNIFYYKQLYSLTNIISDSYFNDNDMVMAGLFKIKSIKYKKEYAEDYYWGSYYNKIAFFDRYGTTVDIDKLMSKMSNKSKDTLDKYLFNKILATKDALLDLKGTIALRTGDIATAYDAFSKVEPSFWQNNYEFKEYLYKDPFIIPYYQFENDKPYKFNKADVVKQLLDYSKKAEKNPSEAAFCYIKMGNFFYNASYRGNSWMMLSYYKTVYPYYDNHISYGYDRPFVRKHYHTKDYEDSFYKCSIALKYYNKAKQIAKDKETIAEILLMKHCCNYDKFLWNKMKDEDSKTKYVATDVKKLYSDYYNTRIFALATAKCVTLDYFAKN